MSVVGARDLPQLDKFGASDPYACISLFLVEGWDRENDPLLSCLDHNVSKIKRKEHTKAGAFAIRSLIPQRSKSCSIQSILFVRVCELTVNLHA